MAYQRSDSSSTVSRSNWNLEMPVLVEGGKPESRYKNPRSTEGREPTTNKSNGPQKLSSVNFDGYYSYWTQQRQVSSKIHDS